MTWYNNIQYIHRIQSYIISPILLTIGNRTVRREGIFFKFVTNTFQLFIDLYIQRRTFGWQRWVKIALWWMPRRVFLPFNRKHRPIRGSQIDEYNRAPVVVQKITRRFSVSLNPVWWRHRQFSLDQPPPLSLFHGDHRKVCNAPL